MTDSNKSILVTGGAGYIGSVLTGLLLNRGYKVRVIDKLKFGGASLIPYLPHPKFEFITGDICRQDDLKPALEHIDAVVHLAAVVGDPACAKFPEEAERTNKDGSELLARLAIKEGVERFVFASTCSNYGKMDDPDGFVDESSPLRPVSLYAELKVGFEQYLMKLIQKGFTPVILRFATAYGLSPRPRFDLTVNEFTRDLALGKKLEIYGEKFWRPYCHTIDLARAVIAALDAASDKVSKKAFNVGSTSENYQKKTLAKMILKELPDAKDLVSYVHRDEDPRDYRVNFERIKTDLAFETTKTVPDGIKELVFAIKSGLIDNPDSPAYRNL
ncbi:MAG: NAD(P)-dependent oxidoreductase [Candidatus Zixiibacteriota bacterium]